MQLALQSAKNGIVIDTNPTLVTIYQKFYNFEADEFQKTTTIWGLTKLCSSMMQTSY